MFIEEKEYNSEKVIYPVALKFAPFWKRMISFIIDSIILIIILSLMVFIVYRNELISIYKQESAILQLKLINQFIEKYSFQLSITNFVIPASYFILQWIDNGQTIGARIMKIVVISANSRKLNILEALIRYTVLSLCQVFLYIPLIFIINPLYKQRIHDFVVNSVVVEIPKIYKKVKNNLEEKSDNIEENFDEIE